MDQFSGEVVALYEGGTQRVVPTCMGWPDHRGRTRLRLRQVMHNAEERNAVEAGGEQGHIVVSSRIGEEGVTISWKSL